MEWNRQSIRGLLIVVCGGIAFCIYGVFFWKEPEKKEKPHETDG